MSAETRRGLQASMGLRRGSFELELELEAGAGEVLALVGPNGAGKSTVLAVLAGLLALQRGEVSLDGRVLERVSAGLRLPPQAREVGVVFQGLALFEHLSALDNVAYGLRARGRDKREAQAQARDWLERFEVAELAERRPAQLSGGQAQRVALARALIVAPRLLLLDEPFAALDADARSNARAVLGATLSTFEGISVLVTHDADEVVELADRVVELDAGRARAPGPAPDLLDAPADG